MIDELLSLAGDAVTHARRLGADAVHAVAADGRSTEISVREGQIEKVEQAEARDISLKVYVGKSSATISGSVLTTEAIRRLAENAVNMAKLAPPDPHAGVADPEQLANDIPDLIDNGVSVPRDATFKQFERHQLALHAFLLLGLQRAGVGEVLGEFSDPTQSRFQR